MNIKRVFKKIGLLPAYAVGIRPYGSAEAYHVKYPSAFRWYADPFVCHDKDREYVFVELMHSYRLYGQIAVAEVIDGVIGDFCVVLDEPFHMSFPNVFQWHDEWYMLPETNMSGQVRLYRAVSFPAQWKLDTVLLDDVRFVDHALYLYKDGFLMLTHDIKNEQTAYNRIFYLDMNAKKIIPCNVKGDFSNNRPGGTFYSHNGKWYHAIQDCQAAYGDYLHIYEVDAFTDSTFHEKEIGMMMPSNTKFIPDNHAMEHLHTYNHDGRYEVIDLQYMKYYPDKFFIHQVHEVLKHWKT